MARYKLGILDKKREGRFIDLDSIIEIENLEQLDNFTTHFTNESELKIYLFNKGILNAEEANQNIDVLYRYNGKVKKIPVFYKNMEKYLDITQLRYELKGLSNNVEFLEKLANFYTNGSTKFNKQGTNVNDIRIYLSEVRNNNNQTFYSKHLEIAIDDLFEKAILKKRDNQTGEVEIDYRGLRDLALLIYKFKSKQANKEEVQKELLEIVGEQTSLFDEEYVRKFADTVEPEKQTTGMIYNYDEDDFAPNSEELRNYIYQLENTPNEGLPDYMDDTVHRHRR